MIRSNLRLLLLVLLILGAGGCAGGTTTGNPMTTLPTQISMDTQ